MAYEVHTMGENSWRIEEDFVRMYLFAGSERALLLDSGLGSGDLAGCVRELTGLPVGLVLSHADGDHFGANAQFPDCRMHPAEYDRYFGQGGAAVALHPLWEGDVIDLGGRRFEVVLIPGHTPGSIALLDPDRRELFAGDSVQCSPIYMFGPGRCLRAYLASMEKLAGMRGRFDRVYACHGPVQAGAEQVEALADAARRALAGEPAAQTVEMEGRTVRLCGSDGAQLYLD